METRIKDKKEIALFIIMLFFLAKPGYITFLGKNQLFNTMLSGMEAVAYVYILVRWLNNRKISLIMVLTTLFIGIIILSSFLSGSGLGTALRDNIGIVCMVMLVDSIDESLDNLIRACIVYLSVMIVIDCVVAFLFPGGFYPSIYEFHGSSFSSQPTLFFSGINTLGIYVLFWMFFKADYDYRLYGRLRLDFYIISLLSIVTFFAVSCLTSIVTCSVMFVLTVCAPFIRKSQIKVYNIYLLLFIILFINVSFVVLNNIGDISVQFIKDILGASTTFNGRTPIWQNALRLIGRRPFLGYGFARSANIAYLIGIETAVHAHNYLLNIGLYGGILAIALFAIIVLLVAKSVRKIQYRYSGIIMTAFMFAFLLEMIFEYSGAKFLWIIFAYAFTLGRQSEESSPAICTNDRLGWTLNI